MLISGVALDLTAVKYSKLCEFVQGLMAEDALSTVFGVELVQALLRFGIEYRSIGSCQCRHTPGLFDRALLLKIQQHVLSGTVFAGNDVPAASVLEKASTATNEATADGIFQLSDENERLRVCTVQLLDHILDSFDLFDASHVDALLVGYSGTLSRSDRALLQASCTVYVTSH